MNPDRIDTLADLAADKVRDLILEARDSITEAINAAIEEAQESEDGKATLRLAPSIVWDLDGSAVSVKLSVTTRRKFEATASLDDPAQEKLPLVDVNIEPTAGTPAKVLRKVAKLMRDAGATVTVLKPEATP